MSLEAPGPIGYLRGSRLQADAIVLNAADGLAAEELAEMFKIGVGQVRVVLDYAWIRRLDNPDSCSAVAIDLPLVKTISHRSLPINR